MKKPYLKEGYPLNFKIILISTILVMPAFAQDKQPATKQATLSIQNSSCLDLFESKKFTNAIEHCHKEARNGSVKASEVLTQIYYTKGEWLNYFKAFEWAKVASDKGSVNSQAMLGLMYLRGDGITKNTVKAQHYIQLAIDNGNKGALELRKLMKRAGLWRKPT
jgi:TPR repeat protein